MRGAYLRGGINEDLMIVLNIVISNNMMIHVHSRNISLISESNYSNNGVCVW